ncbi:MAG TPA: aminoglycoside phosphotransferase family protein [Micromonosporaceae bacterium]|nr:aminoglycoside phosphotransferase family protein [Micromonosporaceae bacterium]
MPGPTQPEITMADVRTFAHLAFGPGANVACAEPLAGGSFATVWRVNLDDGRQTVLKVGPAPDVKLLTYEAGMLAAEAEYLRLVAEKAPEVPAPRLLHQGDNWLFMTFVPGTALPSLPPGTDDSAVRFECGAAIARLHAVTGTFFGYPGPRPHGDSWPDAFTDMIEALLEDAVVWQVALPAEPVRIRAAIAKHADLLSTVTTPALVHFDMWDGNVIATPDGHLSGLVDGERYLYADPLLDFASATVFRDTFDEPDHPFLRGYWSVRPFTVDEDVRRRAWLCQLYLYLVMVVEYPSRGMTVETDGDRWYRQAAVLERLLSKLES